MASCCAMGRHAGVRAARGVASGRCTSSPTQRFWWRGLLAQNTRTTTSKTRTLLAIDAASSLLGRGQKHVRAYRNIWGNNAGQAEDDSVERHRLGRDTSPKVRDDLETSEGGWRLDWEEEGR